jgi:hypothetical protein
MLYPTRRCRWRVVCVASAAFVVTAAAISLLDPPGRGASSSAALRSPHSAKPSGGATPDRRLTSLLGVLRRAPEAADRSSSAASAAREAGVNPRYVRYVGRGLLGGRIFLSRSGAIERALQYRWLTVSLVLNRRRA